MTSDHASRSGRKRRHLADLRARSGASASANPAGTAKQLSTLQAIVGVVDRAEHAVAVHMQLAPIALGQRCERRGITAAQRSHNRRPRTGRRWRDCPSWLAVRLQAWLIHSDHNASRKSSVAGARERSAEELPQDRHQRRGISLVALAFQRSLPSTRDRVRDHRGGASQLLGALAPTDEHGRHADLARAFARDGAVSHHPVVVRRRLRRDVRAAPASLGRARTGFGS